jgi:phospholipid/cholesterol/gamma-HCH transport system permease protein
MTAYIEGLRLEYGNIDMIFAIVKTFVNAIIISTIASYRGYTLKGGSVEVGIQSTNAVVQSSIVIMIFDLVITNLFM